MKPVTLAILADRVAARTGYPRREARVVADELLFELSSALEAGTPVVLRGVGRLSWRTAMPRTYRIRGKVYEKARRWVLKFKAAQGLGRIEVMEKYGVQVEKTKTAGKDQNPGSCPTCGQALDSGGACPTHGTEPFERKPEDGDQEG